MAKNDIPSYDAVAANNTEVQSVDISENCSPAGINNAIREVMADLKNVDTGAVALTSPQFATASMTGDLTLGDNDKAIFGASSDLSVYHNGSHSYVQDTGTGNLYLAGSNVIISNPTGSETMAYFDDDGGASLWYDNSVKIATTSSGATIAGKLDVGSVGASGGTAGEVAFGGVGGSIDGFRIRNTEGNYLELSAVSSGNKMVLTNTGNVGIGTASPSAALDVQTTASEAFYVTGGRSVFTTASNGNGVVINGIGTPANYYFDIRDDGAAGIFRVDPSGNVLIAKTALGTENTGVEIGGSSASGGGFLSVTRNNAGVLFVNRGGSDGTVVNIMQANNSEGSISVSGSTVSYNGGHLARWSQATDGNRIDGLLKGTVMTNLDQMAVWPHAAVAATYYTADDELPDGVSVGDEKTQAVAAYDEDNEQLNCMAVSSVEGDPNVAGVFVNWDDDDEDYTADMNVAMTGDMIIRIAQGTTVARGDLLMSAGDGTAKPQDDDIVRSKTIAKVTSTNISHTYDDGSYCVPCVLMAC